MILMILMILIILRILMMLMMLIILMWKGKRVYEVKRTAHWCVEACNYSYLTALTGGGPLEKEQVMISCLISKDATRKNAPKLSPSADLQSGDHLPHHIRPPTNRCRPLTPQEINKKINTQSYPK